MARSKSRSDRPIQIVWPRDRRPNGSKKRTFFQGLHDILTGSGPDMFVTRKHDKTPIPSEIWGNWTGYHSPQEHAMDRFYSFKGLGGFGNADRSKKFQRYDPQSRRYVEWEVENNWFDEGPIVPRYTWKEHEYFSKHPTRRLKGTEYYGGRPKRLNPEHQPFWHRARRIADNRMAGYMEETDNISADQHYLSLIDRARGTPGLSRRCTIGMATQGHPDHYLGGPGIRRQFSPVWGDYDPRRDNRALGMPDGSWVEVDEAEHWDAVGGRRREYMR